MVMRERDYFILEKIVGHLSQEMDSGYPVRNLRARLARKATADYGAGRWTWWLGIVPIGLGPKRERPQPPRSSL